MTMTATLGDTIIGEPLKEKVAKKLFSYIPGYTLEDQQAMKLKLAHQTQQSSALDPMLKYVYDTATWVHNNLINKGIPEPGASYGTYQTYFETNGYNNNGHKSYNNDAGIMFAGQPGATKGPNGYAVFKNWNYFFSAYVHELKKGANPAGATSLEDFNSRLVKNHYYTADPAQYLSGLKRARLVLKVLPAADRAGYDPGTGIQNQNDLDIPGSTNYNSSSLAAWWEHLPLAGKAGIIGGGALLVLVAIKS